MTGIDQLSARKTAISFMFFFAFLHIGCEGTEVVLALPSSDSDAADNDHDIKDTSTFQGGEDDVTDCGDVTWEANVYINYAPQLKMLEGVTYIKGCLQIQNLNDSDLKYFTILKDLRCVDRYIAVNDIDKLSDLDVFSNLHTVGGDLFIQNNKALTDIDGIHNIQNLGGNALYITDNYALPTCAAQDLYAEISDLGWEGTPCIVDNYSDACDNLSRGCADEYHW